MELTIILLSIIAISEISRLLLTHWPVSKKKHFKQKAEGVKKMIWDLEFKIFKTKEIREDIRKEYDQEKSKLYSVEEEIKNWPAEKDQGDKARIEDKATLIKKKIEKLEEQMKGLDLEISGSKPTNQYPDGVQGTESQIDSLQELKIMLKQWIKSL